MVKGNECFSVEDARKLVQNPRYVIDEFVGSGAMACVYKVSERGTPNIYAMKLLREKYRQLEQFVEIFEREAGYMRDLQYPNIVRFYKFVNETQSAYILMDYVVGKPLTNEIKHARTTGEMIPIPKIVRMMAQIARAIHYLHDENVVHRDIKPGNVLLSFEDESAYLTDLGITGAHDDALLSGAGTPSYMPYEQQVHEPIDRTVDIYAFGVMLYEVFTGRKPFLPEKGLPFSEARNQIIEMHKNDRVPSVVTFRSELPPEIDTFFQQALAKNPAERYGDIMDFAKDIHEALRDQLPPDLQDFESIRPQAIQRSAIPEIIEVPVAPTSFNRIIRGGIAAIILIVVLVASGIFANNQVSNPTATPSEALVDAVTDEVEATTEVVVVTATQSPDEENTPNVEASNTAPPTEDSDDAIVWRDLPTFSLAEGIDAIGIGEDLNAIATYFARQQAGFVPLRVNRAVDGFRLDMALEADSLPNYEVYGIAFRIQDEANYLRFAIQSASSRWVLESVVDGEITELDSGDLTDMLPSNLSVSGIGSEYTLAYDGQVMETSIDWQSSGALALWIIPSDVQAIEIESLQISLLGEEALAAENNVPTPVPVLSAEALFLRDLQTLRDTGTANAIVQCPTFITTYDSLSYHLSIDDLADSAENAQSISLVIYNGCLNDGADGEVDFSDRFSDYLNWESAMDALITELEDS